MRTTRAAAAIARLKKRSGIEAYSLALGGDGLMRLTQVDDDGEVEYLCAPLELDDFVAFVDAFGPQKPKRVSKLDLAFEKQLRKKNDPQ